MLSGPAPRVKGFLFPLTTAGALVYENAILAAASGGAAAPPWFDAALDRGLAPIKNRLDTIEGRLDSIITKIDQLTIFACQNHNRTLGDGRPVAFKPVPFPDGSLPSENDNVITYLIIREKYPLTLHCGRPRLLPI
ncbi:hypothetical protein K438DRAFT_1833226 [Mycena galopus ATCC 62051]|nr:hypothetical protein K438DRAFT_1833226 [Mycena galopus ATCC 62051]